MSGWTVVDSNTNKSQPITGTANSGAVSPYVTPSPGSQDPVGKMRVSMPQALIDTDFEYGQQPTKWESIALQNNRQSCYYIPQSPLVISAITGAGTTTVTITGTFVIAANSLIYIQNAADPNANGWWYTIAGGTNTMTVITNGTVASGNQFNAALTYVYLGSFYSNCGILLASTTAFTFSTTTITCTTASAHGLAVGSLIYVTGTTATTNAPNGAWVVATTPTANTFTFIVAVAPTGTITNTANNTTLYARPAGYVESRSFDGGVAFSAARAVPSSQLIRQTRRYFRYQSGKGIQFSTGTSMCPALFVTSVTGSSTTATVTTRFAHNLAVGCVVSVQGCNPGYYNGTYTVATTPTPNTFTYTTTSSLAVTTATGFPIRISPTKWYGSSNCVGMFDQQNGLFFEYDGQTLYAVWRNSVNQISGTVAVTSGSAAVTGTGTAFNTQLSPGDFVVIRGQSYRVLNITSATAMVITPEYRGTTIAGALVSKTVDTKVPQSEWDDPLDGTGPSGYTLDLTKMQMWYMDYSWYGAGFARWGMRTTNGEIVYCYQQTNNNKRFEAYLRTGNMAAHYESSGILPYTTLAASITTGSATTLSAALLPNDTTIFVTSTTGYTSTGGVALIGTERVLYSATGTGRLVGCVRGFANTRAGSYASGTSIQPDSIQVNSTAGFPSSGSVRIVPSAVTGVIEYVTYTGIQGNLIYGLTRGVSGGGAATAVTFSATAPCMIEYASPNTAASVSHWGSSVIMDGRYDDDKSLIFNYGTTTAITTTSTSPIVIMAIRLAPAVDNGTTGLMGVKEIINRSQLQLESLGMYTTGTGFLINLILNGFASGAMSGSFIAPIQQANGITSSLAQVATNTNAVTVTGGESVFAAYSNNTGNTTLDLSVVRDLGNSILGGGTSNTVPTTQAGFYPDGPDILYIVATPLSATSSTIVARLNWKEAQA